MESEIRSLIKLATKAQKDSQKVQAEIEQQRETIKNIKIGNDERIHKIQEENRELDSELATKEAKLNKKKSEIEEAIYEAKTALLKRVYFCNLKNILTNAQPAQVPENTITTIYKGQFCTIYDIVTQGNKPVNAYEYCIKIELVKPEKNSLNDLLSSTWPTYKEIHWGWSKGETSTYFQRDFGSPENAKKYGERNKEKITKTLIEGITDTEKEINDAETDINTVFDFRLLTHAIIASSYSRERDQLKIVFAQKHKLVVSPVLSNYEKTVEKVQPYKITITQKDDMLTIKNHRFTSQAMNIRSIINGYFKTDFKAIEADTKKEVPERHYY